MYLHYAMTTNLRIDLGFGVGKEIVAISSIVKYIMYNQYLNI